MKWMSERPKKPGWYWYRRDAFFKAQMVEIIAIGADHPEGWEARFGQNKQILGLVVGEWIGPLQAPE